MTAPAVPEGLEPVGVWDAGNMREYGFARDTTERAEWARKHLGDPRFIRRVEFHLLDSGFAVVHACKRNADGFKYQDPETGLIATEEPVIVPLAELPPARLLKG